MTHDADDGDADEHHRGHREGDDDVAGEGEGVGDHPEEIAEQDEHEEREDEGEIAPALVADIVVDHLRDEFVEHLGDGLPATGHQRGATRPE